MILQDIQDKLNDIEENVFYGMVSESMNKTFWNYIVFNRSNMKPTATKQGYADVYEVHIVRENFIPDGFAEDVINKMLEIAGMRVTGDSFEYNYIQKPNTDIVVEMLSINFVKPRKA